MSLEAILDRLQAYKLRPAGKNRYRSVCPVRGERNASTLSVGSTPEGAVLLKCFKSECGIDSICSALGLEVADLFPPRESYGRPLAKRNLISARQALDLLHDEALLIGVAASNIAHGVALTDDDRARLLQAAGRVAYLRDEVMA